MPLTLRDLAPLLSPYQPAMGMDLSGVANHLSRNNDRAQQLQIAQATDATNRAQLAENIRSAQAQEQQKRDDAQALLDKQQHEEEMKLVSEVAGWPNPILERIGKGRMASAGMGVVDTEGVEMPFAPGLSLPGLPPTALKTPEDFQAPVSRAEDTSFNQFIESAAAPATPGTSPLGYSPDRTIITGKDGRELTEFSPSDARTRAREQLMGSLDDLLKFSPELSAPIAERAYAMADSVLQSSGYDPQAALDMLVAKTFTPEMQQIYANERSKFSGMSSSTGRNNNLIVRNFTGGSTRGQQWLNETGAPLYAKGYREAQGVIAQIDSGDMNPAEVSALIYNAAKSNDPRGIVTRQDFEAASGNGSLLDRSQAAFERWFTSAPPTVIARLRQAIANNAEKMSKAARGLMKQGLSKRSGEIDAWGRKGFDQKIESFDVFPWYAEERANDPEYMRLRRMVLDSGDGGGGYSSSTSYSGGAGSGAPVAAPSDGSIDEDINALYEDE